MTSAAARTPLVGRLGALVIDRRVDAGRAALAPRGELVHGCAGALAGTLVELPADVRRVELDMTGVLFMDTAGLQFLELLDDYGRHHGTSVRAVHWNEQPRRILELAGLNPTDPLDPTDPRGSSAHAPGPSASSVVVLERTEQLQVLQEEVQQLRRAIASRPVIDQARGILMATHACTSDEAWTILREASQLSTTKLRTVAAAVTASTGTDGSPPPAELRGALRTALTRQRSA